MPQIEEEEQDEWEEGCEERVEADAIYLIVERIHAKWGRHGNSHRLGDLGGANEWSRLQGDPSCHRLSFVDLKIGVKLI